MSTTDHRLAAHSRVESLVRLLTEQPNREALTPLLAECQALARAIQAFHMEGIRFRMYNVDRMLFQTDVPIPVEATAIFADTRAELEAAGFHTRSHKAPS